MSPPLLGVGVEEAEQNVTTLASSASIESSCQSMSALKEHNYMGLSDCSSVDSSTISTASEDNNGSLNLKDTELRLGLPGSQSPERDSSVCFLSSATLDEKLLFPLHPLKNNNYLLTQKAVISGNKRGFSDAMDGFSEGTFLASMDVNLVQSARPSANMGVKPGTVKNITAIPSADIKDAIPQNVVPERPHFANENSSNCIGATNNNSSAPATKAQVVGWPPIRSFRKNTLATTSKNIDEVDGKTGVGPLFVKVSMDGAPYLRKVDLRTYSTYQELSSALEKMFSCFTIGQHGVSSREMLCESKLKDLLHGSEYVLAYEDKDGDWMLVGDVPWEMFTETCKRLRIMKSSDAIGLAPRAVEKCKNRN